MIQGPNACQQEMEATHEPFVNWRYFREGAKKLRQVLDCASPLALSVSADAPKAAEDCRTPRCWRDSSSAVWFILEKAVQPQRTRRTQRKAGAWLGDMLRTRATALRTAGDLARSAANARSRENLQSRVFGGTLSTEVGTPALPSPFQVQGRKA